MKTLLLPLLFLMSVSLTGNSINLVNSGSWSTSFRFRAVGCNGVDCSKVAEVAALNGAFSGKSGSDLLNYIQGAFDGCRAAGGCDCNEIQETNNSYVARNDYSHSCLS